MVKPTSVNTDLIPMATGAKGSNSRSAGNVMPGPSAIGGSTGGMSGAAGGVGANPARSGGIAVSSGAYGQRTGSPAPAQAAVQPGTVSPQALGGASDAKMSMLAHGRVLAGIAAIRAVHGDHPHLASAHSKSSAHIKGYKGGGMKKQGMAGGPSFGALGGSNASGKVGGGIPGAGGGMPSLPDDM